MKVFKTTEEIMLEGMRKEYNEINSKADKCYYYKGKKEVLCSLIVDIEEETPIDEIIKEIKENKKAAKITLDEAESLKSSEYYKGKIKMINDSIEALDRLTKEV